MAEEKVQPVPWVWRVTTRQDLESATVPDEVVGARAVEMAALDDDHSRSQLGDPASRFAGRPGIDDPDAGQDRRLGRIRGDHRRQRQQDVPEGRDRVFAEQPVAALGDHDRVDDQVSDTVETQPIGDDLDDRRA
jgi:hypothetical protein